MAFLAGLVSQLVPNLIKGVGGFVKGLSSGKGFVESAKEGLSDAFGSGGQGDEDHGLNENSVNSYIKPRLNYNPNQINNQQYSNPPQLGSNDGLVARNNSLVSEKRNRDTLVSNRRSSVKDYRHYSDTKRRGGRPMSARSMSRRSKSRKHKSRQTRKYRDYFDDDE